MEYSLKRDHTGKDVAISATILLAGIGLFFVNKGLGICIGICGVLMCLFYKGGYKKDGRGILLSKKSEDICKECRSSILEFLEGKNAKPELKQGKYDFCNYNYEPATGIIELDGDRAEKLISSL